MERECLYLELPISLHALSVFSSSFINLIFLPWIDWAKIKYRDFTIMPAVVVRFVVMFTHGFPKYVVGNVIEMPLEPLLNGTVCLAYILLFAMFPGN